MALERHATHARPRSVRAPLGLWLACWMAGCGGSQLDDPPVPGSTATRDGGAIVRTRAVARVDVQLGQSVQGRPIAMAVFRGDESPGQPGAVLVIGGIHGNERSSVDVARGLLGALEGDPSLARGRTVAIIDNANPDGYLAGTRTNANSIDVNRNFPAKNFKPTWWRGGAMRGGREAASEPETRAILAAIERLRPALIISIHSMDGGRECNNYDGPAAAIAKVMERHNGYPAAPTIGYPTPGSLGTYAGVDLQIPTVTLELPRNLPGDQAWQANRTAILAAIATAAE